MRLAVLSLAVLFATAPASAASTGLSYPPAPRGPVTDTYFGTVVPDPYRWLEDVDSAQTTAWVAAENSLTRSYLDAIPARTQIAAAYRTLYDYEKVGEPFRAGKRWFFYRNSGLQTQSALYVRDRANGPARLFFDPNTLSKDGSIQMAGASFTHDGTLMAYATQVGGADWLTWHVKRVADGRDLPDRIAWSKFSDAAWVGDRGFYYAAFDEPKAANRTLAALDHQKLYFHRLGTPQSADRLVYASPSDEFVGAEVSHDQRLVFLEREDINANGLAWKRVGEPDSAFRSAFGLRPNVQYAVVGNDGTRVYLSTNRNAPRFRVVWVELTDPRHVLHQIVPERADKLDGVSLIGNRLYLEYLHDAHSVLRVADLHGRALGTIALPGIGSVSTPSAKREDRIAYYTFESYTVPPVIYRYDTLTGTSSVEHRTPVRFDSAAYVTEQEWAVSKDGTRVPVFVMHRKGVTLDGSTPTILYGYGGFNVSITPGFAKDVALWLQMGGAYAVAVLRGGGEFGDAWHEGGMLANKQHVFDDFIAAAQMLIASKLTSTPKLAIDGGSNGGLLVGATLTQRPDLFGAAIAEQGVLDMLRYPQFTDGKAWIPEYGSALASAAQFQTLFAYSPLDNVKPGTHYPPTLITTADHDDRVFPAHSYKFVAALQQAQAGDAPILLRVETNEGHFSGLTTDKAIAITADFYAFLVKNLNFTPFGTT
jgi:prolyl oligopeptidase